MNIEFTFPQLPQAEDFYFDSANISNEQIIAKNPQNGTEALSVSR